MLCSFLRSLLLDVAQFVQLDSIRRLIHIRFDHNTGAINKSCPTPDNHPDVGLPTHAMSITVPTVWTINVSNLNIGTSNHDVISIVRYNSVNHSGSTVDAKGFGVDRGTIGANLGTSLKATHRAYMQSF